MEGCPAGIVFYIHCGRFFAGDEPSVGKTFLRKRAFSGEALSAEKSFQREALSAEKSLQWRSPFGREESSAGKNPPIDLKIAHSLGQRLAAAVIRQRTGALSSVAQVHCHQNIFILGQTQT